MADSSPYRIGLVMAGAVSAGAYTAGVLDFLMEALETWERKKQKGEAGVPTHITRLDVMAGASAGSIAAAVLVSALRDKNYPYVGPPEQRPMSKLYENWVQRVDIKPLLALDDLDKTAVQDKRCWLRRAICCVTHCEDGPAKPGEIQSVLNADALDAIANTVLDVPWTRETWPSYLNDPVTLYFTITNLRGVPYSINFTGDAGNLYGMTQHADYMSFRLDPNGAPCPPLDLLLGSVGHRNGLEGHWGVLGQSALASGAFPVGLAPRVLKRAGTAAYDERLWNIPTSPQPGEPCECSRMDTIQPSWPDKIAAQKESYVYEFVNVDGGVANNEPFELARRYLADGQNRLQRGAKDATASVLMVDPFPNSLIDDCDYKADTSVFGTLGKLVNAVLAQLRFKTEELALAKRGDVHSRWVISPRRSGMDQHPPIASAALGAFGGFLSQKFRDHDYQIGRRNCQRFLQETLLLHEDNPVFSGHWTDEAKQHFGRQRGQEDGKRPGDEGRYLPVIPLYDACTQEVPEPAWPKGALGEPELAELSALIKRRMDALFERFVQTRIAECVDRQVIRLGWKLVQWRRALVGKESLGVGGIMNIVRASLKASGLS